VLNGVVVRCIYVSFEYYPVGKNLLVIDRQHLSQNNLHDPPIMELKNG